MHNELPGSEDIARADLGWPAVVTISHAGICNLNGNFGFKYLFKYPAFDDIHEL